MRARGLVVSLAAVFGLCLVVCGVASATLVHPFVASFGAFGNPQALAVDRASGDVYVLDVATETVQRFDASGSPADFSALGSNTLDGVAGGADATPEGGFSFDSNSAAQVAVDNSGGPADGFVYVANSFGGGGRIDVFDSTGAFVGEISGSAASPLSGGEACGVAVAPSGAVYASYYGSHIDRYTPTDGVPSHDTFGGQLAGLNANCNIAVDSAGSVYASTWATGPLTKYAASQFGQASAAGTVVDAKSLAVAVDASTDDVFVDEGTQVVEFDSSGSLVGLSGAGTLSGSSYGVAVNATTGALYASDAALGNVARFGPAQNQLVLPEVTTQPAQDLAPTHATLRGVVAPPQDLRSTYYLEYGTSTSYGTSVPATRDGEAGSTASVAALERLDGLQPGTTYHYRLVASDRDGSKAGQDQVFTTTVAPPAPVARAGIPGTGVLPDGRGWEMVSPVQKEGADVMADSARTRAASDGNAAEFTSLEGFGDVQGGGVATEYMAIRDGQTGTGWATHAITPRQNPLTFDGAFNSMDPLYEGDFSPDLSKGVFRAWSPLTSEPNVANVENDYLRTDLRTTGSGSYELLSACPGCGATPLVSRLQAFAMPRLAGASADFGHVIFESTYNLTSDAPSQTFGCFEPCRRLYEWDHGTVRLAGILPDGSPAASSIAGRNTSGSEYTMNTISADGSRIFFTDNSGTNGGQEGALYVRIDHSHTLQINASEKVSPDPSQPASFWAASRDGSRVFFTTAEQLTADDTNPGTDLYMWDEHSTPRLMLLSNTADQESAGGGVEGAIGASADGHWVYYVARGQMVPGEPTGISPFGIFLWHDGQTSYVGQLAAPVDIGGIDLPNSSYGLGPLEARVSPDGQALVFTSHLGSGLTGYDQTCAVSTPGCTEVYLYRAVSRELSCVSCDPSGARPVSNASINVHERTGGSGTTSHLSHALSDDGMHVFFSTADPLVPEDTNGKSDAYEYDAATGTVHLLSSGKDPAGSYFMDASPDGSNAFFLTAQQLVGWDNDRNYDLYDARVGGGLPEPPAASVGCSGDGCRVLPAGAPAGAAAATSSFDGLGNANPPVAVKSKPKARARVLKCRRGFARKKKIKGRVRCVKVRPGAKGRRAAR